MSGDLMKAEYINDLFEEMIYELEFCKWNIVLNNHLTSIGKNDNINSEIDEKD